MKNGHLRQVAVFLDSIGFFVERVMGLEPTAFCLGSIFKHYSAIPGYSRITGEKPVKSTNSPHSVLSCSQAIARIPVNLWVLRELNVNLEGI